MNVNVQLNKVMIIFCLLETCTKKPNKSGLTTGQMINFDKDNNNNNNNVFDELRSQVNKLTEEIKNVSKNSSYSLSLLIDINKVEQDAKTQQQKLEV